MPIVSLQVTCQIISQLKLVRATLLFGLHHRRAFIKNPACRTSLGVFLLHFIEVLLRLNRLLTNPADLIFQLERQKIMFSDQLIPVPVFL